MGTSRRRGGWVASIGAAGLVLAGVVWAPATAQAAGATYNVIRCHAWNRHIEPGDTWAQGGYSAHGNKCGQAVSDWSYQIKSTSPVSGGRSAAIGWSAPAGTAITSFSLEHDTRTADKHYAEIQVGGFGGAWTTVHRASNEAAPFRPFQRGGLRHHAVRVVLYCADGGGCSQSHSAHAFARNVQLTLADAHDPGLTASGGLLSGGWKRGAFEGLTASAGDYGSGVRRLDAVVNGVPLGLSSGVNCNGQSAPWTIHMIPCGAGTLGAAPNTAVGPFRNGDNALRVVAEDFAGNATAAEYNVRVDNAPPQLAFANSQDAENPELIRAPLSDPHSGVAAAKLYVRAVGAGDWLPLETRTEAGEARARVDSLSMPAGEYEFRATAIDVAGNAVEATHRKDGEPMRLLLPLRPAVTLRTSLGAGAGKGQTVPYGTDTRARGRLLDASGQPLAGREILVVENFGQGALIRERPTRVVTDEDGRWRVKIPAGPTRRVSASFAGTSKYAPEAKNVGKLTVKSRASLRAAGRRVSEGDAAVFRGKVGHFGARIPAGGKLVELQVRMRTGRWDTVGQAFRTDERGRYRRAYRFGKHYVNDTAFRFRVKVQKERNWPYKRAASKQRRVVVRAR